ncbi:phytanoyl-CoA dioxygenase family protein [Candidatus Pseudothioglobus singularis]|nr:phytanoyl-CoA dioxygenase family protein [Candidatus Pseudothioglobus singularis]MDB4847418.1 phytanoyl-CoA dioxygenase family protein [Candidatus Pseudothioglobus singularis]
MIKASLTEKQLIDFNNDGFLTVDNFIELQYLEDLKTRINLLFKGSFETGIEPDEWNWRQERDPSDVTRQICNAWKSDILIKRLVCSSIIGESVSKLMGWKGARLVQDNVLWKPPQGKALNFHQDAAYDDWIIPQTMVTCWMPLDDTFKENGTLEFARGSHKWDLCPPSEDFHAPNDYKKELHNYLNKNDKTLYIDSVQVPAGGVSFHHGHTWHGSGPNKSNSHRRAIVAHCVPIDAKFHPTNCGGTGKIYKKYKLNESDELSDSFFPPLWQEN